MADNSGVSAEASAAIEDLGPPPPYIANISYHITIKAGDRPIAGPDANVYFALHGDKGETKRITLQEKSETFKRFQRRRVDNFVVTLLNVGKLEKLVIGYDSKGEDVAWYLEEVDVYIPARDEHYKFRYGGWLEGKPDERKEAVLIPDIPYHITIITGDKPSAGTDANVYIALHGDKGETPRTALQDESQTFKQFQRRRADKFSLQTADVGKLEKIVIGHDNKGQDPAWYLEEVDVKIPGRDEHYKFRYGGWLGGKPDQRKEAVLIPDISHRITIKTGDKPSAGTDANVYIALHGDKRETPRITLQDESQTFKRFQRRRVDKFALQTADVGKLEKLVIGHDNKGQDPAWYLEEVDVNIPVRDEHYKFRYSGWLGGEPDQRKEAVLFPALSPQDSGTLQPAYGMPPPYSLILAENKGLSTQAPGTHPINVASTASVPSFHDLPQFRVTCRHCSEIFVVHTTRQPATCPHCRIIFSVENPDQNRSTARIIIGFILFMVGIGVTFGALKGS